MCTAKAPSLWQKQNSRKFKKIRRWVLACGIQKSTQTADSNHPYTSIEYISSLISGVGIFCVSAGLAVWRYGLINPGPMDNFFCAFFILGGSLVSEGTTLLVAVNEIKRYIPKDQLDRINAKLESDVMIRAINDVKDIILN